MTTELKTTLAEHCAGNYRVLMNLGDELMTVGYERGLAQIDEDLFLDHFHPQAAAPAKPPKTKSRRRRGARS